MKKYLLALALVCGIGFFSCTMNHNNAVAENCCAHSGEEGHVCPKNTAQAVAGITIAPRYDEQVNTSIAPPPGCAE